MNESPSDVEANFAEVKELFGLNYPNTDWQLIKQAYDFDVHVQGHKTRKSGESAVMHPLTLALSLLEEPVFIQSSNPDIQAIYKDPERVNEIVVCALIHDVIEELTEDNLLTEEHLEEIRAQFGNRVYGVVGLLTKNIGVDYLHEKQLHSEINDGNFSDPDHAWKNRMQREQLLWHTGLSLDVQTKKLVSKLDERPVLGLTSEEQQEALTMARVVKAADLLHNIKTAVGLGPDNGYRFIEEAEKLWIPVYDGWGMPEITARITAEIDGVRSVLPRPEDVS